MLDIERIRNQSGELQERLEYKGFSGDLDEIVELDAVVRGQRTEIESLRERKNQIGQTIGGHHSPVSDVELTDQQLEELSDEGAEIRERISALSEPFDSNILSLKELMFGVPNVPSLEVPVGPDYEYYEVLSQWGDKPTILDAKNHNDLGQNLGILDVDLAKSITGPRFAFLIGKGAVLQRALTHFMLDRASQNGYTEYIVPQLVNQQSLYGTGQFPKFKEDVFETSVGNRSMYLSPTAEVQLTNIARDRVFRASELPMKLTTKSENYRSEAGSAGRDMVGIFRQHQFPKVELIQFTTPDESERQHKKLTADAESVVKDLGLHYRKVILPTGDTGFSAAVTHDIEVWLPGQDNYREISSCSNCTDFQARRINAKYYDEESDEKRYIHTLNGSGVAIGRAIVAILEQYQQPDGSVIIPEALRDYTKFDRIDP